MSGPEGCSPEVEAEIKRRLKRMAEVYGEVPLVSEVLAASPDLFLPFTDLSKRLLLEPQYLSSKEMEIAAVAASVALGSEFCLNVHLPRALKTGATREELIEVIMIASFMSMTKAQSVAFRKLDEQS
ncbi:MAG: carboxymuconolactone decarboxylase family protein [Methanomassiliicoccus sp.]|nr:carboxymuconolactone decarboxylase family protein [Methanomassiliicoccus sp.]